MSGLHPDRDNEDPCQELDAGVKPWRRSCAAALKLPEHFEVSFALKTNDNSYPGMNIKRFAIDSVKQNSYESFIHLALFMLNLFQDQYLSVTEY